jgi:hypothetical protein
MVLIKLTPSGALPSRSSSSRRWSLGPSGWLACFQEERRCRVRRACFFFLNKGGVSKDPDSCY